MELLMELLDAPAGAAAAPHMTFRQDGGVIGRGEDCDWVIPDQERLLSSHHARVSFRDGAYFLTDTSSNGIVLENNGAVLQKGLPQRIEHGNRFRMGRYRLHASLRQRIGTPENPVGQTMPAGAVIPDDAFLELDPLQAVAPQADYISELDLLRNAADQAPEMAVAVDEQSLPVPELVTPVIASEPPPAAKPSGLPLAFWREFGEALGIELGDLDEPARQALAVQAAQLLRQSLGGLQQALRTRGELKNELRLPQTGVQGVSSNPLKHAEGRDLMRALLRPLGAQPMSAQRCVSRAFRDLQAHQVALLAGSRAVVRGMLEQCSPEQLVLQFERERKPLVPTAGSRWRAYRRWHQRLQRDDDWSERLFGSGFAQAYEEQVRLIATLDTDTQG